MPFGRPTPKDDQRAIAYRDWVQQRSPFSIASIVLGIFSLLEFGTIPIFSLGAIVLGIMALKGSHEGSGFGVQGSGQTKDSAESDSPSFTPTPPHPDTPALSSSSSLNPEPRTLNSFLGRRLAITGIILGTLSFAVFIFLRTRPTGH